MTTTLAPGRDALDRLLDPLGRSLDAATARQIAEFRIDSDTLDRIDELAERCAEGTITDSERAEYEGYVQGVGLINVLRSKALASLSSGPP